MTDQSIDQPLETCQTCKRDFNPSLVESGECIFCIAKAHKERAEKAEAASAEMRALVRPIDLLSACSCESCNKLRHAISSDCGKGWMAPEKAQRLREALQWALNQLDARIERHEDGAAWVRETRIEIVGFTSHYEKAQQALEDTK